MSEAARPKSASKHASSKIAFERVKGVSLLKNFGPIFALRGVDVELQAGEVLSIEGGNGSGKSTLISLLSLMSKPTEGAVYFDERRADLSPGRFRGAIACLSHTPQLYADLSAEENLLFFATLVGAARARVQALIERLQIQAFRGGVVRDLSRGQRQRVSIARALLSEPSLLLLDEPTTGLDVRAIEMLAAVIDQERARGAIIALVTHDAAFAQRIADRRIELRAGKRVA